MQEAEPEARRIWGLGSRACGIVPLLTEAQLEEYMEDEM